LVRAIPGWKSTQGTQQLDQWQQQVMQGAAAGLFSTGPAAGSTAATTASGAAPASTAYSSFLPGSSGGAGSMAPGAPPGVGPPPAPNPYGTPEAVGPSSPWLLHRKVSLGGEVKYPGIYAIRPGESLSSVIQRAGGFTVDAFPKGAVFTRVRVREQQQKQMDDTVNKLEVQLLGTNPLAGIASSSAGITDTKGAAAAKASSVAAVQQKQDLIATLRSLKASGRMVIKLDASGRGLKGPEDLGLEDGDTLFIPKKPFGVQVMGEVFNPTSITYVKGMGYKDYINLCGAYTAQADKDRIYILKADGSAVPPKPGHLAWSNGSSRWEVQSSELEPGDTVVVPTNYDLFGWFDYIKGVSEIFFHIATSAGVVLLRVL